MDARVNREGTTVVYLGNEHWLVRLERRGEDYDFLQAVMDLFSDGVPQAITAIASSDDEVYVGVQGIGLVRRYIDRDCGYHFTSPETCDRPALDGCSLSPSVAPPNNVAALEYWGSALIVATDSGILHYLPTEGRFSNVAPDGTPIEGTATDMEVCGETMYIGTREGLWAIEGGMS
jgi:hypothetical protein